LDELVLLVVGIDEVEPDRILRYGDIRRDRHTVERCAARNVDPQHDPSADPGAPTRSPVRCAVEPLMGSVMAQSALTLQGQCAGKGQGAGGVTPQGQACGQIYGWYGDACGR